VHKPFYFGRFFRVLIEFQLKINLTNHDWNVLIPTKIQAKASSLEISNGIIYEERAAVLTSGEKAIKRIHILKVNQYER